MSLQEAVVVTNELIAENTFRMALMTKIASEVKCGQFLQIQVPGFFLRRPISVCEVTADDMLVLVYRIAGDGTRAMSELRSGTVLDVFGPLGNGFPVLNEDVVLVGGGVGIPPLVETAKQYRMRNHQVTAVLGYTSASQTFLKEEMERTGAKVITASMDGSTGIKGTVIDALKAEGISPEKTVLACGPKGMLKAVSEYFEHGYISLEERMACGIGACMGCVVRTPEGGTLRVCKDGPVFEIGKAVL